MKKRLLAMIIAVTMLISIIPSAAFAVDGYNASGGAGSNDMVPTEGETVSKDKFVIYKDDMSSGHPSKDVKAGQLSDNAPDLSAGNLYFDHAEVNGVRVYEVGTLTDDVDTMTFYGSITGTLAILGEGEHIELHYVSKYPVRYQDDDGTLTEKINLVKKGESLTFRAKPSEQDMRLEVTANDQPVSGTVYDDATGEMIFTVENVQEAQDIEISQRAVESYTLRYSTESDAFRNGEITSENNQTVAPGGNIEITMQSEGGFFGTYYTLNMLVINGHEVMTLPSDAQEGATVTSALPSGETVIVTLTQKGEWQNTRNTYRIDISNVHTDLDISEGNFKNADREEIILKELTGVQNIKGWDFGSEAYLPGSINMVYLQTGGWGNAFHFNLLPGYQNPELTVKTNGQEVSQTIEITASSETDYQYGFNIPDGLGDNVEVYLTATPIEYKVEYRNDKNDNDLIGEIESGFTVVEGNHDTITITNLIPYETVAGFTADGYLVEGGDGTVYHSGDTVKVADVAPYITAGQTITFVPNWKPVDVLEERQITVNLYIENPAAEDLGTYLQVDSYQVTVGQGTALLRPNDERGREHLREYMNGPSAPDWKDTYNISDFALKYGENAIHVVEAGENSLDFHYDVKKGTLTVNFEWGTGETSSGGLPGDIIREIPIRQGYSVDITNQIPAGYMASMNPVTGTMTDDGTDVEKTVYLYQDENGDGKPDKHTITLTFSAGEDGTISTTDQSGSLSPDKKTLTYTLVKEIPNELTGDKYPDTIPNVTVNTGGQVWLGWFNTAATDEDRYASYAGKDIPADAENITFEARYDVAEGYELVTINYYLEQEDGGFGDDPYYTISKAAKVGDTVTYTRNQAASDMYVTPNEGTNGEITVATGGNTVKVYYYSDKDKNNKPDDYTLTLSFTGTSHGSWDTKDSMWAQMEEGKDYVYNTESRTLEVYLVKENNVGFQAETYPDAPKVEPEEKWLFDSWQDASGNTYGSSTQGDGVTIGAVVGANDTDKSYTSVYDRDLNGDGVPDNEQTVTVTFLQGDHGTITGQAEFEDLVPRVDAYPTAPEVTAEEGYEFTGWDPAYNKSGAIEAGAQRQQTYTATYRQISPSPDAYTLIYDANGGYGGPGSVEVPADEAKNYALNIENTPKHMPDEDDGTAIIFIGWSEDEDSHIYSASDGEPETVDEITLSENTTVYAVWGYDANEDGTPDVEEQGKYTLTYDGNTIGEGDVVGNTPEDSKKYVSGQTVVLATDEPTYTAADESKVVFIGWSAAQTEKIYGAEDKNEFESVEMIPAVTFADVDMTVYAVWGYDENGDDRPDVQGDSYVIYPYAGQHGSIAPDQATTVEENGKQRFSFEPEEGYAVDKIIIDGDISLNNGELDLEGYDEESKTYTFTEVQDDHTIVVTFSADTDGNGIPDKYEKPDQLTITARAGKNGTITPSGTILVEAGSNMTFTITPDAGYRIADVTVNGQSVGAVSSYEVVNITEDIVIKATFEKESSGGGAYHPEAGDNDAETYVIEAEAGKGGSISPDGEVEVKEGKDKTFRMEADEGYEIEDVLVDGESVGAVDKYTFEDVRDDHTIEVIFAEIGGDETGVSAWLNTADHMAYLNGYTDGSFGVNAVMTRAEAAQMFYNLLLDQNVPVTVSFTDVPADAWYADAVHALASLGMIEGMGNGQFGPERSITRAEFTAIAMRFAQAETDRAVAFTDVQAGDWFYDAVAGATALGWINGYSDGTFRPYATITRAEVTAITNRMLGRVADASFVQSYAIELRQFTDVTPSHWASADIAEATNAHHYTSVDGVEVWDALA